MAKKSASFRFYAQLNDFLSSNKKQKEIKYAFWGTPSVKDAIESLGIPHSEVELILVNNEPVSFNCPIINGDMVGVFPVFRSFDTSGVGIDRGGSIKEFMFVIDANMGKLARLMRMAGFDSLYSSDFEDDQIVSIAQNERRIILTRDVNLLKRGAVIHGYFVRATDPWKQLSEVLLRFGLHHRVKAFKRCLPCNGVLELVDKDEVKDQILAQTARSYQQFFRCSSCGKVYWQGSHYERMNRLLRQLMEEDHRRRIPSRSPDNKLVKPEDHDLKDSINKPMKTPKVHQEH